MGELSRDILKQRNARNAYFYWIKWNFVNTYERVWNVAVRRTPCPPNVRYSARLSDLREAHDELLLAGMSFPNRP